MGLRHTAIKEIAMAPIHYAKGKVQPMLDRIAQRTSILIHPQAMEKLREAYREIFDKLYLHREGRYNYGKELSVAAEKLGCTREELLAKAREQLDHGVLKIDVRGRIINAKEIGAELGAVLECTYEHVAVFVLVDGMQIQSKKMPLPEKFVPELETILSNGEGAVILFTKLLPDPIQQEARTIGEEQFHGLSWLDDPERRKNATMSEHFTRYFEYATVRVLCTGRKRCIARDPAAEMAAKNINEDLETANGFEKQYIDRLARSATEHEKSETLLGIIKVCGIVVIAIKALEFVLPSVMHVLGGALDDLFGAIIPDVSQSVSHVKGFWNKVKKGWGVFLGGATGLPVSLVLGAVSTALYSPDAPIMQRVAAGITFAIACCAGTVGTSIAAVVKSYRALRKLEIEGIEEKTTFFKRLGAAINEAIIKVPFRVGHTLIGLPMQLALGAAAGIWRFYDSSAFIIVEGMLETILGAAVAFTYSQIANTLHARKLKHLH